MSRSAQYSTNNCWFRSMIVLRHSPGGHRWAKLRTFPRLGSCSHCTTVAPKVSSLPCAAGSGRRPLRGSNLCLASSSTPKEWRLVPLSYLGSCESVHSCSCTRVSTLFMILPTYVTPLGDSLPAYAVRDFLVVKQVVRIPSLEASDSP